MRTVRQLLLCLLLLSTAVASLTADTPNLADFDVYVAGGAAFTDAAVKALRAAGVADPYLTSIAY